MGNVTEMVVASDSRLGGGERWDACAKIFDIGRDDAVIAFAGNTWRALPLVFQAISTTRSYRGSALRTLDLPQFARHLENILNVVLEEAKGTIASNPPECEFMLAGWSWRLGAFRIYRFTFDEGQWRFNVNAAPQKLPNALKGKGRGSLLATIGDGGRSLVGAMARDYNKGILAGPLDYRPLEYLHAQTMDKSVDSVGGPVQVAKVYRSIRVEYFAVRTSSSLTVSGRPVLPYENLDLRAIERDDESGQWITGPGTAQIPAAQAALAQLEEAADPSVG